MTKTNISREAYEAKKKEITNQVNDVLEFHANEIVSNLDDSIKDFMISLWSNRKKRALKNGRLRDMTVYLTLKMFDVEELSKDHMNVIAAGEFYNMASYYQNWHLDDKKNVTGGYDTKLCHIASHLYREKAHELVMKTNFSNSIKLQLLHELSESNRAIQIGQSLEMAGSRIIDVKDKSEDEIFDIYSKRCEGMSGRFYGASFAMGAIMADEIKVHVDACRKAGTLFGTGLQMINDLGDFCLVPSLVQLSEKDYQDQFADLMKGTMTLPTYELSKHIDINDFHSRILTNGEKEDLFSKMLEIKAFHSTRKKANIFKREITRILSHLPENENRSLLKYQVALMFNCNKFYVNLRENHGYVWGV